MVVFGVPLIPLKDGEKMPAAEPSTTSQKGPGRPKTGRGTKVVSLRIKLAAYEVLERKARAGGHGSVNLYVQDLIHREIYRHLGQGTRTRLAREKTAARNGATVE